MKLPRWFRLEKQLPPDRCARGGGGTVTIEPWEAESTPDGSPSHFCLRYTGGGYFEWRGPVSDLELLGRMIYNLTGFDPVPPREVTINVAFAVPAPAPPPAAAPPPVDEEKEQIKAHMLGRSR